MAATRKSTLSMKERLEILQDLEMLKPIAIIAAKYHVHHSTISRIKKNAAIITEFAEKQGYNRKRMRKPFYMELEDRLFTWFQEKKTNGDFITDALIVEKAAEIKEAIPSCSRFKVSKGWLENFKKRNKICLKAVRAEQAQERRNVPIEEEIILKKEEYMVEDSDDSEGSKEYEEISYQENEDENIMKQMEMINPGNQEEQQNNIEQKEIIHQENQVGNAIQGAIINQGDQDENATRELEYLFERLVCHSATAPRYIQVMVEGVKLFFLTNRND
ncbi:unnamed protein product [Xylocopa violacea]|uniref:HTH CENPB-type domain-containing protein n=1 Tax=Xylocopa violacea TaxID=135666 RepID=A0ABP1NWX5_XYLVO